MAVRFAPQALALGAAILLCLPVSDAADSSKLAARCWGIRVRSNR